MHSVARLVVVAMVVGVGLVIGAAPAQAHPLGNFTVNRYARLELSADVVRVLYVLDLAEIPAFQERREVAGDRAGYARARAEEIARGLDLVVGDRELGLELVDHVMDQPPGQGGLTTLRLTVLYTAELPAAAPGEVYEAVFADTNQPDRIGWREIVVTARGQAEIIRSDVPSEDVSHELRDYPDDLLQSPLDRRRAHFAFTDGAVTVDLPPLDGSGEERVRTTDGFAALITRTDLQPLALAAMFATALGFGAVHALGPGHGKTIMAAYLVGTRGRSRDAVLLGGIVSLMHTASVLVLGLVLLQVDRSIATESAYPALTLMSGVAVTGVGAWLLFTRWRRASTAGHGHGHHDGHEHDHHHDHGGHGHDHVLPAEVAPLSRRGILALATAGGLFPSPSAVVVMVSAVAFGRALLGLALLAAFSVGLAVTLTAVGLGLVYGRDVLERHGHSGRLRFLPIAGAVALIIVGVAITVRAMAQLG